MKTKTIRKQNHHPSIHKIQQKTQRKTQKSIIKKTSKLQLYKLLKVKENNLIVLRPRQIEHNTKIANYIHGVEEICNINLLKAKFKTFFTLDYMNYINLDNNNRHSDIAKISLEYDKKPLIIEGYLAITISSRVLYESYMLDRFKLFVDLKNTKQHRTLYFPQDFPNNLISQSKTNEIMNQVYTIIKYIAIILAYQKLFISANINKDKKTKHHKHSHAHAFEIIKVRMCVYDDYTVHLDNCKIIKDWLDTPDNIIIINWLNKIFFKKILSSQNHITSISEINEINKSAQNNLYNPYTALYKLDLSNMQKNTNIPPPVYASSMSRSDFNNKFMIVSSDFIKKDYTKVDFDFQELIKYLKKYGLEFQDFYTTVGTKPAFIFYPYDAPANRHLITQHYNTPTYCANMLDSLDNINNKSNLFFYLKKLYPDEYRSFIADSFLLSRTTRYIPGKMYIARPINHIDPKTGKIKVNAFAGQDIIYITNPNTLEAAKRLLGKYDNILISDYITNPLLFRGRKFHLRVYLLITYINSKVKTHFFQDGYIWTAAKPFVLDKFDDKGIHDTHYTSTDDDYLFSSDFNTENMGCKITEKMKTKLLEDMQAIMDKIAQVLVYGKTGVKLFTNHKNGFQIEGIDIMINDKMQPILIECNNKAGISDRPGKGIEMQKRFIAFINKYALEPVFGSKS